MKKKILSVILSFAFVVSMLAAPHTFAEVDYADDIAVMKSLGFLEYINTDDSAAFVTRAEFASEIVLLLGLEASVDSSQWFDDVDKNHAHFETIAAAARNGIIYGTKSNFYPDRIITYSEAAAMLVNALGGKDFAEFEGAYPNGYLKVADSLKINKSVSAGADTQINVGMAARLLLNTGNANVFKNVFSGGEVKVEKGDTLFWVKQRIDSGKGILSANQYTSIDKKPNAGKNSIRIGDFEGNIYYNSDESEYLGYYVEYYYREENGENTVYYMEPLKGKNEIKVIADRDILGYDDESGILSYRVDSRKKDVHISPEMAVIFNGKLAVRYYIEKNGEEISIFDIDNGEIKLVDNDGDGKPEVINVLSFQDYFVSGVNKKEGIIYDMYGKPALNFMEAELSSDTWIITDESGKVIKYDEVPEKSILSVAASADNTLMRAILCNKSVTSAISEKFMDADKPYIKIGDQEYEVYISEKLYNDRLARIEELKNQGISNPVVSYLDILPDCGTNITAYLGYMGKISAFETGYSSTGYAFVMKKYYDEVEDKYSLRLITQDGTKNLFNLANTVKIDGESYKYATGGLNGYMQNFSDYQMIVYELNSKDEVALIDTVQKAKGGSGDLLRSLGNVTQSQYFDSQNSFAGKTPVAANAVAFSTPPDDPDVKYDFDLYAVASKPSGFGTDYKWIAYARSEDSFMADCIQYVKDGASSGYNIKSPYMLVTDMCYIADSDGDPTFAFSGYSNGDKVERVLSQDYQFKEDGTSIDAASVQVGDLIKYTMNARQEITYIVPIKRMGQPGAIGKYAPSETDTTYKGWFGNLYFFLVSGYIQSREGEYIGVVPDTDSLSSNFIQPPEVMKVETSTNIYYVSKGRKTMVEKIDNKDLGILTDYKHNLKKTEVFGIIKNAHLNMMIVYEE